MDRLGRELTAIAPDNAAGYGLRVSALTGLGAPVDELDALAAAFAGAWAGPDRATWAELVRARVALYAGDFDGAVIHADQLAQVAPASLTFFAAARGMKADALAEAGRRAEAGAVALDLVHRLEVLPVPEQIATDPTADALAQAHAYGAIGAAEYRRRRDAWVSAWRSRLNDESWSALAGVVWARAYAAGVGSERDAEEALAKTEFGALPPPVASLADAPPAIQDSIGETCRLASRLDDARAHFEAGAEVCSPDIRPKMWGLAGLAHVLERQGDAAGACAAYAKVLARWGHARPRSILADEARTRAERLGCAPL
jgi:serine/threonine-protein kinase